jgi:ribosomal protein S18 acetylase RimI-like enzyme
VIELRVLTADDWQVWRRLRLQALAEAPNAFGSKLSDWQGDGDREERWRQRLQAAPLNLAASVDGTEAGMASGVPTERDGTVELISMWVSPGARGRGVGESLISRVIDWARGAGAARVVLNVKVDNPAAISLYSRQGFLDAAPEDRDPGADPDEKTMVKKLHGEPDQRP